MTSVCVMLVEDDPGLGMIISHSLRSAGYRVVWAKDGIQAMQLAKQHSPALIVSDFMFPAGGGATFFHRLRMLSETASVPLVILSALPKEQIAAAVGAEAHAHYLLKPYKKDELLGLIAGLLAGEANSVRQLHDAPGHVAPPKPKPARGTVLIIDGKGEQRALARSTLQKKGFLVVEADDGAAAIGALGLDGGVRSHNAVLPNLIVLDAQIDSGAGHLIADRLAREAATHSVPVLVITAGKEMRAAFSHATNVVAYLEKPLDPQRLLRHAEELVPVKG